MSFDADHPRTLLGDLPLTRPGLFITATDTDVGKTVATCALAWSLRRQLAPSQRSAAGEPRIAVAKPLASGCDSTREGLVSADAEAIAHFSDCRAPLSIINPVRYAPPLSPAVVAEQTGQMPDWRSVRQALIELDQTHDALLIEGVGGILAPLDPRDDVTVLDLCRWLGYPVLIVCRAGLGTLNHTAMTVRLLHQAGCRIAGIVVNGYRPDHRPEKDKDDATSPLLSRRPSADARSSSRVSDAATTGATTTDAGDDPSMSSNLRWLKRMNQLNVLAVLPQCEASQVLPHRAMMPRAILEAAEQCYWPDVLARPTAGPSSPAPCSSGG